jgi:hypothetical protein
VENVSTGRGADPAGVVATQDVAPPPAAAPAPNAVKVELSGSLTVAPSPPKPKTGGKPPTVEFYFNDPLLP